MEDLPFELAQLGRWGDSELVTQHRGRVAIDLQCLGLAATLIQGPRQPEPQALTIGMLDHKRLEVGNHAIRPTDRLTRIDKGLARADTQLGEALLLARAKSA